MKFIDFFKKLFSILFSLTILLGVFWVCFRIIKFIIHLFKTLNPNVSVAIIVASATIITSTLTIVLGRYFESKKREMQSTGIKKLFYMMSF